jgi:hypothetical protein
VKSGLKLREQFARDRRNVFDAGHRQQNALPFCAQTSAKSRVNPALNADRANWATIRISRLPGLPRLQISMCFHCYSLLFGVVVRVGAPPPRRSTGVPRDISRAEFLAVSRGSACELSPRIHARSAGLRAVEVLLQWFRFAPTGCFASRHRQIRSCGLEHLRSSQSSPATFV